MDITLTEEWRAILGYEGLYEVSTLGRVRGIDRVVIAKNGRSFLRQKQEIRATFSGHYLSVSLSADGVPSRFLVHRLVALAFIPNPECLPMVNHLDAIKTNNVQTNLEWSTAAGNTAHAMKMGLLTPLKDQTKLTDEDVIEVRRLFGIGTKQIDIARQFSVSSSLICMIVNRKHRIKPRP